MVSGVSEVQHFKSNKGYFSSSASQASSVSGKRFADNALRPWPPMYRSTSSRAQANYQALSVNSAKVNFNNFNGHHATNNSIYGRTKFNFHQFNIAAAAAAANKKYASSMNLTNMKNTKNYMMPPPSQSAFEKNQFLMPSGNRTGNGAFYGHIGERNNNSHMEKNRFRKLRNPSTVTPPTFRSSASSCPCTRSKSMEDVRTEIVTDWTTFNKENYNEFKRNKLSNNRAFGLMKHGARRSMDNLLEVDTDFGGKQRFQVRTFYSYRTRSLNRD